MLRVWLDELRIRGRYWFVDIDYVDLIDCHFFLIQQFVSMLEELGLGVDSKPFTHFMIPVFG